MHFDNIIETVKHRKATFDITQEDLAKLSGVGLRAIKVGRGILL